MAASHAGSPRPATRGKVLIVDDEADMRDLLKAILEGDYHVSEAGSGAALHQALDSDHPERPDVVLLGMKLPDASGLGLLHAIKQRWPATEVIVLTGTPYESGAAGWAVEAVNRGAFDLLSKSAGFDFQKLLASVGSAVARCQQNQGNAALRASD